MKKNILILNAGSATLKFGLFDYQKPDQVLVSGIFERVGLTNSFLHIGKKKWLYVGKKDYQQALRIILEKIKLDKESVKLIGHRVVHGGPDFRKPIIVTNKVWKKISKYNELAPLHNPANLAVIKACYKYFPKVKNVAVFDTAFFEKLKQGYFLLALPYNFYKNNNIRRYGFHGISHQWCAERAAEKLRKKLTRSNIITVHLGNGCSIAAIKNGIALKTSMGFTPVDGLVMGTRSGDLDPAVPLYIQKKFSLNVNQVEEILNKKSGLLGLSGFTSDMREILKAAGQPVINYHGRKKFTTIQKKRAKLALDVFITRLRTYIILYTAFLGKVDAIVFTGGIGERSKIIRQLSLVGIKFIKRPKILVVPTNEELSIAKQIKNVV